MSDPPGLASFLAERLDEAETAAKERRGIFPSPAVEDNGAVWLHVKRGGNAVVVHYAHPAEGYGDMADLKAWAETGHGWTQDRALRAITAKRRILELSDDADWLDKTLDEETARTPSPGETTLGEEIRRAIAAEWADHPAYQPGWSPEPATAP